MNPTGQKYTDLLNDNELNTLKEIKKLPENWPKDALMADRMALSLKATADNYNVSKATLGRIYGTINDNAAQSTYTGLKAPAIKDPAVNSAAESAATKYNVPAELVKGIITQESGGNPNAVNKDSGATGLMQLMPATAAKYGVTDSKDIQQNIDGATHYLSDLLKQNDGNIPAALKTYGGFVTKDPTGYVNSISKMIGLDDAKTFQPQVRVMLCLILKLRLTRTDLPESLAAFQGAINATVDKNGENLGAALKQLQSTNPSAAASVLTYLGGTKPITDYDAALETNAERRKATVSEQEANQKNIDKTEHDAAIAERNEQYLNVPTGFQFKPEMTDLGEE